MIAIGWFILLVMSYLLLYKFGIVGKICRIFKRLLNCL